MCKISKLYSDFCTFLEKLRGVPKKGFPNFDILTAARSFNLAHFLYFISLQLCRELVLVGGGGVMGGGGDERGLGWVMADGGVFVLLVVVGGCNIKLKLS